MNQERILFVAATPLELESLRLELAVAEPLQLPGWPYAHKGSLYGHDVLLVASGVGKASAAAAVAATHARYSVTTCINVGIAGAYVGAFLPVGVAVAALRDIDLDAGVLSRDAVGSMRVSSLADIPLSRSSSVKPSDAIFEVFPTDPTWTQRLSEATRTSPQVFATSDAISGDLDVASQRAELYDVAVESMEGAGVGLACHQLGLAFAEIRGISNVAGVRDNAQWQVDTALTAMTRAVRVALQNT